MQAKYYQCPLLCTIQGLVEDAHYDGLTDVEMAKRAGISQPSARAFRLGLTADPSWSVVSGCAAAAGIRLKILKRRKSKAKSRDA
jgi:hypothetical protein